MAAVIGFDESDVRVGKNFGPRGRRDANEGIVGGVKNEGRDSDLIYNVGGCSAGIVVGGAGESRVVGGDFIVEVTQGANPTKTTHIKLAGEQAGLGTQAAAELQNEVVLVNAIGRFVQGVGGCGEINSGTHRGDSTKLRRAGASPFPGEFEDKIAAHGITREREI